MRDKILFVDDVYQAFLTLKKTLRQPENQVYLAPPKYFPTFDTSIVHILRGELISRLLKLLRMAKLSND